MTPHAQHHANHFAKSSELAIDYHKDNHQHTAQDIGSTDSYARNIHSADLLHIHVERVVRQYFAMLGDEVPTNLYELILRQIEEPLLSVVLEQTRGNQTKCAQILGLNRGTLRKKLKTYDLM